MRSDSARGLYGWNDYAIEWSRDAIAYYVNGTLLALHRNQGDTLCVPARGMAYHNWVDNRIFTAGGMITPSIPVTRSNYLDDFKVFATTAYTAPASCENLSCLLTFYVKMDTGSYRSFYSLLEQAKQKMQAAGKQ